MTKELIFLPDQLKSLHLYEILGEFLGILAQRLVNMANTLWWHLAYIEQNPSLSQVYFGGQPGLNS